MAARNTTLGLGAILMATALTACGGGDGGETLGPPVGKHVVFTARESGDDAIYIADTGRPGEVLARLSRKLEAGEHLEYWSTSPDGRWVAYSTHDHRRGEAVTFRVLDPTRPGSARSLDLGTLFFQSELQWSASGRWAVLTAYDDVANSWTLMFFESATLAKMHVERSLDEPEVLALPGVDRVAASTAAGVYLIDLAGAVPSAPQLRDVAPAGHTFEGAMHATPDGSRLLVPMRATDGAYALRLVRVDGAIAPVTITPTLPAGTWVGIVGVTDTAVVYAAGPSVGGPYSLHQVAYTSPGAAIALMPAGHDGVFQEARLSPDRTQVAWRANAGATSSAGIYVVDLATPGVAVRRAAPAAGETRVDDFAWVQGGAGLVVTRASGASVPVGGYLKLEREMVRVGSRADEGELVVAGMFPSGANPSFVTCDDGLTLLVRESEQFPPGTGGVPESYPWLGELHVARADARGTLRLTKGYDPWRGVGGARCLATRR